MTEYVLLVDDNDDTIMVGCEDRETARSVASAAVFSTGDVSAYLVPRFCTTQIGDVTRVLREHGNVSEVANLSLPETPVRFGSDHDRVQELEAGIRWIVNSWEGGDLAGAVNEARMLIEEE